VFRVRNRPFTTSTACYTQLLQIKRITNPNMCRQLWGNLPCTFRNLFFFFFFFLNQTPNIFPTRLSFGKKRKEKKFVLQAINETNDVKLRMFQQYSFYCSIDTENPTSAETCRLFMALMCLIHESLVTMCYSIRFFF